MVVFTSLAILAVALAVALAVELALELALVLIWGDCTLVSV